MADSFPPQPDSATIPPTPSDPMNDRHKSRVPTGMGKEPLNILILGASFAGLSCAHHFLDYTYSKLNTSTAVPPYRLVIVSPSTHIYWNIAAPRAIVGPDLIKEESLFKEVEEGFHRHRGSGTVFVQGEAVGLDLSARVVRVSLYGREGVKRASLVSGSGKRGSGYWENVGQARGKTQLIPYHALIMATGSSAHSELLSLHGTHLNTIGALTAFHARAAAAKSIVVCGGGPSGVECAGQLAAYLNYSGRGPFRRRVKTPKEVTLITGGERCLPALKATVGLHAERKLKRLGVEIRHGVRVLAAKELPAVFGSGGTGQMRIELNDDSSVVADLYIPCTGVEPNSSYAPPELKDGRGYVETDTSTLRIGHPHAGPRLYALGDVASYSQNYVLDVYAAVPVLMHNLLNDLLAYEYHLASPYGGNQDKVDELIDETYTGRKIDSQLCPISRFGGAGMLVGIKVPSWVVHVFKGRDYRVGKATGVVRDGGNPYAVRGKYE